MMRTQRTMKIFLLLLVVAIVIVLLSILIIPAVVAELQLDIQLYDKKAYGVDFVTVNLLNWAEAWAPLIPAACVTAILFYPRKFLSVFRVRSGTGRAKLAFLFSAVVFLVSYGISWLAGDLSYGMFMAQYLQNDPAFVPFLDSFKALLIPFNLAPYDTNVVLTWKFITMPILNAILTALIIRMVMEMIGARVNGGYAIEFLGRLFVVIGIILGYFYLASPLTAYDSVEKTWLLILPLTMWTFVSVGTFCLVFSLVSKNYRDREEIAGAGFILTGIVIIAMVIVPCIVAASDYFSREVNYDRIVWNGRDSMVTSQTRVASDLTGFNRTSISELLKVPTNPLISQKIRPYDKNSTHAWIEAQITTPYETEGDTDIIAFNGSEYWTAPVVFYSDDQAFGTAVNRHMVFTATGGFVAMDAHGGNILTPQNCIATFGVNSSYPFYFGEGYRNDIILGVSRYKENRNLVYTGEPDATLSGYSSTIKVLGMSIDFVSLINQDLKFLHRTNVIDRVEAMLLPYMYIDEDPYLLFDKENQRVFYCMPVYISLPGFTYFKTDYKRFLGWVLVDVYDGYMNFYRSPKLDEQAEIDDLISFAQVYVDTAIYPWQNWTVLSSTVKSQLRYPENLYESQLETDYTYHVDDWQKWHDKTDFFNRPPGSDLYYVFMDLGSGLEFVGVDLVVPTSGTTALAGMYVLRNRLDDDGKHFGETIFYRVEKGGDTLIGPSTAEQALLTYPGISSLLTPAAIQGRDTGNILLYEFQGSLYYIIPIYSTIGLQTLKYVGIVNGFDQKEVVLGHDPVEAFNALQALQQSKIAPAQIVVNCTGPASVTTPSLANVSLVVQNTIANMSAPSQNFSVNMYVYSKIASLRVNGSIQSNTTLSDPAYLALGMGQNFSLGTWSLAPSAWRSIVVQLNLSLGNFSARNVPYRFVARLSNGTSIFSPLRTVTFFSPSYAASNISGSGVTLGFTLPTVVAEPNNANLVLSVKNDDMNFSHAPVNVKVNLTLFSVNGTVRVPGIGTITGTSFADDPWYPGISGKTYTVISQTLAPQDSSGITVQVDLDMTGNTRVELVYRLALIVNLVEVATTWLRVITWTA
ncbi:MAG: UPF0182 family protein [Candidatus Sigynarchaeum springense]